ncbi:MAG: hypothetical protein C5B49_01480 [Bdellovibrio sp.]|nr:MAG: hypothetical protein C5B49_01480 [Bdellovibrio sp.]
MSMFSDRLQKNHHRLKPWADRQQTQAFRLYDWDIPEYPCSVDLYKDELVVADRGRAGSERDALHFQEVLFILKEQFPGAPVHVKKRRIQTRTEKYQRLGQDENWKIIQEGPAKFLVNLQDYLDTGLFLDHRPLRHWIRKEAAGKRVLNLFCYTGAISVAAAQGGGSVTSVDLSERYLEWGRENFRLNKLEPGNHRFVGADVVSELSGPTREKYDLIILDPPTFSNSKKMERDLDVQRDHARLISACVRRVHRGGHLYFSTNKSDFRLDKDLLGRFKIADVSKASVPPDFHRSKTHRCYRVSELTA